MFYNMYAIVLVHAITVCASMDASFGCIIMLSDFLYFHLIVYVHLRCTPEAYLFGWSCCFDCVLKCHA